MICFKCGHEYDDPTRKFCENCKAPIPRFAPANASSAGASMIDVTDGGDQRIKYLSPEKPYQTELMLTITEPGYRYFNGEITAGELKEVLSLTREKLETFKTKEMTPILDELEVRLRNNVTVEYCRQLIYLIRKGAMLFEEGLNDVESSLESDNRAVFMRGFLKMQEGNDYMAMAQDVVQYHLKVVDSEIVRLEMENKVLDIKIASEKAAQAAEQQRQQMQQDKGE